MDEKKNYIKNKKDLQGENGVFFLKKDKETEENWVHYIAERVV